MRVLKQILTEEQAKKFSDEFMSVMTVEEEAKIKIGKDHLVEIANEISGGDEEKTMILLALASQIGDIIGNAAVNLDMPKEEIMKLVGGVADVNEVLLSSANDFINREFGL